MKYIVDRGMITVANDVTNKETGEITNEELHFEYPARLHKEIEKSYEQFNQFLNTLSKEKSDATFAKLDDINYLMRNTFNLHTLYDHLKVMMRELADMYSYEEFNNWCGLNVLFNIPDSIKSKYEEHEIRPTTVNQTYIEREYREILVYSFALRLFWPIWTKFIILNNKVISDEFKENYCFKLLDNTWVTNNHIVRKLEAYIESNIKIVSGDMITNAVKESSVDRIADILLASIIVSKLSCYDNQEISTNKSLIHSIFHFIGSKVGKNRPGDKRFNGAAGINEKKFRDKENGEEIGILESFKAKRLTSPGSEATTNVYLSMYDLVIARELIGESNIPTYLTICKELNNINLIRSFQYSVTAFILSNYITSKSIYNCDRVNVIKAISLATTWLLVNGHNDIACVIASKDFDNEDDIMLTNTITGRNRIPATTMDKLKVLFPIVKANSKHKDPQIIQCIQLLDTDMSTTDRQILIPKTILDSFGGALSAKHNRYTSQMSICVNLANFIIDCCVKLGLKQNSVIL